jgi:hypothetical protein
VATPNSSIITSLSHPTRRGILRAYLADGKRGRRHSPVRLAEMLHIPVNDVAYHVRVLARNKALRSSGTKPVRGATEHFYVLGPLVKDNEDVIVVLLAADAKSDEGNGASSLLG